jgi:outer membrane receptor protein involved in Fe transport
VKGTWRASPQWTVDASIRYEASRISSAGDVMLEKTLKFVKPRLAVSWEPMPGTQLRLRAEREVGQLDFDDFVASTNFNNGQGVSAGNPDLNPQQAWVLEGELEQRFWKGAAVTLSYRHYELKDVIDRGPVFLPRVDGAGKPVLDPQGQPIVDVFDQPDNIGDGTKDELTFSFTLPSDHFGWKGGLLRGELNKRWSDVTDPTTLTSRRISRQRPLEWEVHYSQDLPRYGASYGFDLYGGWSQVSYRFNYISDVKLHNSYLVLFTEKRLNPTLTLRLEMRNATERGIRIATKVYDGPRSTGGLAYTDDRNLIAGRSYYIRLRKTFGS